MPARDKPDDLTGPIPWLRIEDFDGKYISESKSGQGVTGDTIREMNLRPFPAGTVVCTCSCDMGTTAIVRRTLLTNQTFIGLVPRAGLQSEYLYWAFQAYRPQLNAQATGAIQQYLSRDDFRSLRLPIPPPENQKAIADYLDAEISRIDALIEKKRRLIDLLERRFESFVLHLVSGQHIHGPRRSSGLDWLGDIPTSWTVQPVSANFSVTLGKMVNPEATGGDELYPYLRNTNVKWDGFDLEDLDEMSFDAVDRRRCELRGGDLLVCEGGEVGRAAVWEEVPWPCFFQKAIQRVRPIGNGNTRFLMYCLRAAAGRDLFNVEGNQSTIVHLTREKLRVHRFPYPDLDTQAEVGRRLDQESDATGELTTQLGRQLNLLAEHRQALIIAAVTGELDIPGVAA